MNGPTFYVSGLGLIWYWIHPSRQVPCPPEDQMDIRDQLQRMSRKLSLFLH